MPDVIGSALYEWHMEKQGVQQELISAPVVGGPPALEHVTLQATTAAGEQLQFNTLDDQVKTFIGTCPDCGSQLEFAEGCVKCHVCGFSECG